MGSMLFNLDIDNLRKCDSAPQFFGLGFIQLKLNPTRRIHFYHPKALPIVDEEEIHDHRYDFVSHVQKGAITNRVFHFDHVYDPEHIYEHELFEVSCKKEDAGKAPNPLWPVKLKELTSFTVGAGHSYMISKDAFHKVSVEIPTITYLIRGDVVKNYAHIIKPIGNTNHVCPFSKSLSPKEIWDIIEDVINA